MEKLYTPEEIAEVLKKKLGTIWKYLRENKIKAMKVGREYRIKESDLKAFMGYPQD